MSKSPHMIDDTILNALLDHELSHEDEAQLLIRIDSEAELQKRYYQLQSAKQWTRLAFGSEVQHTEHIENNSQLSSNRYSVTHYALAASLIFCSLFSGWLAGQFWHDNNLNPNIQNTATLPEHYVIHIDSNKPENLLQTLTKAEELLNGGLDNTMVEIVTNAGGLDLLRSDMSPYAQKVSQMMDDYDNLLFIACSNAIQRMQDQGEIVHLIDGTVRGQTAVDEIVDKVQKGWNYIRI